MTTAYERVAASAAADFGMGAKTLYSAVRLDDLMEVLAAAKGVQPPDDLVHQLAEAEAARDAALVERDAALKTAAQVRGRAQRQAAAFKARAEAARAQPAVDPGFTQRISELETALTLTLARDPLKPLERRAVEETLFKDGAGHDAYLRQTLSARGLRVKPELTPEAKPERNVA